MKYEPTTPVETLTNLAHLAWCGLIALTPTEQKRETAFTQAIDIGLRRETLLKQTLHIRIQTGRPRQTTTVATGKEPTAVYTLSP